MTALSETKKYQAYPEYKDSRVEWVGDIPVKWEMWKLSHAYREIGSGTTPPTTSDEWFGGDIPWVTTGELRETVINGTKKNVSKKTIDTFSALRIYPAGSVAMAMYGATIGRLGIFGVDATTNQACCVMTASDVIDNKYLFYWLWAFRQDIINLSSGGGQPNINQEKVASLKISAPIIDEQTQIANFLDHEIAKIDTLIEKQQQLIKLLKEKRQAVISHSVTKGLNPQAPMKDSGVEWLGEVPEHWEIVSVRNLIRGAKLQIQDGNHGELHPVANDYVDDGIPFLMANNVRNGKVDTSSCKRIPKALADKLRIGFAKAGDMLLTHKGTVGEVGIIPEEMREDYWMLTPQVTYYRWLHHSLYYEFFYYQFQSVSVATQLDIIAGKQSTRGYVGLIAQGDIELAIPPLNEQLEIASQLQADVKKHEDLIQKAEELVLLQKERRTALISAAVTGKIDVQNWQAPTPQVQALEQTA
ncbi:restriction endonuclease subunit S [Vibrio parahaemolyticus]|nr:restriction endonuclease subunit S [Vibrio parahaemolyticus]